MSVAGHGTTACHMFFWYAQLGAGGRLFDMWSVAGWVHPSGIDLLLKATNLICCLQQGFWDP
jgi:hypothetical protein